MTMSTEALRRLAELLAAFEISLAAAQFDRALAKLLDLANDFGGQGHRRKANAIAKNIQRTDRVRQSNKAARHIKSSLVDRVKGDLTGLAGEILAVATFECRRPSDNALSAKVGLSRAQSPQEPVRPGHPTDTEHLQLNALNSSESSSKLAVRCDRVTARYPRSNFELSNITLDLALGEILGIIGVNGSGKTTLARHLAGHVSPANGKITFPALGLRRDTRPSSAWRIVRDQIGYVPQFPARWYGRLGSNLSLHASLRGHVGPDNVEQTDFWLHRLRLFDHRNSGWNEISGGLRVRFELARVLLDAPKLLILDEPLAHLDVLAQQLFLTDLREIADATRNRVAVVVVSQHLHEVESIADNILLLDAGKQTFFGPPATVRSHRPKSLFEVSGHFEESSLLSMLAPFGGADIYRLGTHMIISTDRRVSMTELLGCICDGGLDVSYVRDLSNSTVRLILEEQLSKHARRWLGEQFPWVDHGA